MLVGGVIGAVVIPPFSDRQHKRKKFILFGFVMTIPFLVGLTFGTELWILLVSAFGLGFFLTSAMPIGMQYAAEITRPTPEGTSNGLIQLFGQASVVFVYIMEAVKSTDGSFTPALLLSLGSARTRVHFDRAIEGSRARQFYNPIFLHHGYHMTSSPLILAIDHGTSSMKVALDSS